MIDEKLIQSLLDTGRANIYMYAYLEVALKEADLDESAAESVRQGLRYALDMFTASEILANNR